MTNKCFECENNSFELTNSRQPKSEEELNK